MNEPLARINKILRLLQPLPTNLDLAQRFGSLNDGGYVLINDLKKSDFLISMGVADDVDFELEISPLITGTHLYDFSIDDLPVPIPAGKFFKEKIGGDGRTTFHDVVLKTPNDLDLILKIDIEGSEWEAIDHVDGTLLNKFRQIVIEYHGLEQILVDEHYLQILRVLQKIDKSHFVLNVHGNNWGDTLSIENITLPSVFEVTYLRRDSYQVKATNELDRKKLLNLNRPCNPNEPEIYFPNLVDFGHLSLESNSIGNYSRFLYDALTQERDALTQERDALTQERDALTKSTIWRVTSPYRSLCDLIKGPR
jgi:hypothetical protein